MKAIKNTNGSLIILALILVAAVIQMVRHHVGTCFVVEGDSMYPTFNPKDVVLAKTFQSESQRGDVLIITDNHGERVIKRIIGLPRETVTIYRGFVYIDRQRIREPYLSRRTYTFKNDEIIGLPPYWQLGDDEYFVLGDNRVRSHDSRNFGPVTRHNIHGVVGLPEKEKRPGFCGIMLIRSGNVTSAKFSPRHERTSNPPLSSGAKT